MLHVHEQKLLEQDEVSHKVKPLRDYGMLQEIFVNDIADDAEVRPVQPSKLPAVWASAASWLTECSCTRTCLATKLCPRLADTRSCAIS